MFRILGEDTYPYEYETRDHIEGCSDYRWTGDLNRFLDEVFEYAAPGECQIKAEWWSEKYLRKEGKDG